MSASRSHFRHIKYNEGMLNHRRKQSAAEIDPINESKTSCFLDVSEFERYGLVRVCLQRNWFDELAGLSPPPSSV